MSNDSHIILDKELRRDIDAIIQWLKLGTGESQPVDANGLRGPVHPDPRRSRERSLAITKLQEAVMWLGMDLKAINDEATPAPDGPMGQEYAAGFNIGKAGQPLPDLAADKAREGHAAGILARGPYPDSKNPGNTVINPTADGLTL